MSVPSPPSVGPPSFGRCTPEGGWSLHGIRRGLGIFLALLGAGLAFPAHDLDFSPPGWCMALNLAAAGLVIAFAPLRPRLLGCLSVLLLAPAAWTMAEWKSQAAFMAGCGPDRLLNFHNRISERGAGPGRPLSLELLAALRRDVGERNPDWLTCQNTGAPYGWSSAGLDLSSHGLAVWDGAPHGLLLRRRHALTLEGGFRHFTESEFRELLRTPRVMK